MELMNCDEVCEFLQITRNNLYQIKHRGQLKWVEKKGKAVFYNRADVILFKEKRDT